MRTPEAELSIRITRIHVPSATGTASAVAFFVLQFFTFFSVFSLLRAPATGGAEPLNPLTLSVTS